MSKTKMLEINSRDLPIALLLKGENGQQEVYMIAPAGRKFGACLQKVNDLLRLVLLQRTKAL